MIQQHKSTADEIIRPKIIKFGTRYRIKLSKYLSGCPTVWQNFIRAQKVSSSIGVRKEVIIELLKPYNVEYYGSQDNWQNPRLDFEREEDVLAFILRWS